MTDETGQVRFTELSDIDNYYYHDQVLAHGAGCCFLKIV